MTKMCRNVNINRKRDRKKMEVHNEANQSTKGGQKTKIMNLEILKTIVKKEKSSKCVRYAVYINKQQLFELTKKKKNRNGTLINFKEHILQK